MPKLETVGPSKYKALAQAIRDDIGSGQLTAGVQLPPVRDLAYRIGATPGTVSRAYRLLIDEGRLEAGVGRGTFVAQNRGHSPVQTDPLIHMVEEEFADFRSSRVPDVGQGPVIDAAFIRLGQSHRRTHINYPTARTDFATRAAVAGWIDRARIGEITADDVILGNGAQNCCIIALQSVLRGANPVILTEELSYPGVRHAARLLRANVIGVEMDDQGIIPEALARTCREHGGQVLITAPSVHSPTTTRTTLARKQELAAVADRLSLSVIEDDCHGVAPSDVPTYRALMDGRAFYVSSLTKSVSGALRFGYMVSPQGQENLVRQVAQSSFYGVAQPILDVCEDLLISGAAAAVREKVIAFTAHRVRQAVNRLGQWDLSWNEDAPFVWLQMPTGWRASGFAMACEREGIMVRPADEFALSDGKAPNAVRLSLNTCGSESLFLRALDRMNDILANPVRSIDA